jgi:hypothetical protein
MIERQREMFANSSSVPPKLSRRSFLEGAAVLIAGGIILGQGKRRDPEVPEAEQIIGGVSKAVIKGGRQERIVAAVGGQTYECRKIQESFSYGTVKPPEVHCVASPDLNEIICDTNQAQGVPVTLADMEGNVVATFKDSYLSKMWLCVKGRIRPFSGFLASLLR